MLESTQQKAPTDPALDLSKAIGIVYKNYRGETARRRIVPQRLWFGATKWHPDKQWLLDAIDVDKRSPRSFALRDIQSYLD
jgi:predicted DNA-binding transcriptional regulator YafY